MRVSLLLGLLIAACGIGGNSAGALEPWLKDPASSSATQSDAVQRIPFHRITGPAQENIRGVVERPSFFRRLPTQTIECDPELFILLVRYPEIIVNIWDLMDITKVEVKRIAPYVFTGQDGAGTTCRCELLYGTSDVHVYYGTGTYSGSMAARAVDGRCVCVLHSSAAVNRAGRPTVTVGMDVFMKLDNFGADLLTRTLGPLVGKTADYNFVESAKFVAQLNELCVENPEAVQQLAMRLDRVDPAVRAKFAQVTGEIAEESSQAADAHALAQQLPIASPASTKPLATQKVSSGQRPPLSQATKTTSSRISADEHDSISSRSPGVSASLSDGGIIVPVKPPISLRR